MKRLLLGLSALCLILSGCQKETPTENNVPLVSKNEVSAPKPPNEVETEAPADMPQGVPYTSFADIGDFTAAPSAGKVLHTIDGLLKGGGTKTTTCQVTYRLGDEKPKHEVEVKFEVQKGELVVREYLLDETRSQMSRLVFKNLSKATLQQFVAKDPNQTASWAALDRFKMK